MIYKFQVLAVYILTYCFLWCKGLKRIIHQNSNDAIVYAGKGNAFPWSNQLHSYSNIMLIYHLQINAWELYLKDKWLYLKKLILIE